MTHKHPRPGWAPDSAPHEWARFTATTGVRIHYLDTGDGPGQPLDPIVFVPGVTCVADDYIDLLPTFGRRILVVDLRGRGRSDTPDTGYSRDDHVADIEAVLDDAGVDRFHLMSFSRGTAYALPVALRQPDRVRTIAIGDYIGGELGIDGGAWPPKFMEGRWRGAPVLTRIREVALSGIARESVERRYYHELGELAKPMLVVRSGAALPHGHLFIDEDEQAAYRRAGAEIVTFEDSPHDLFRNEPTRFPSLVSALVAHAEAV
jgi:non-heme chloroperoxidase